MWAELGLSDRSSEKPPQGPRGEGRKVQGEGEPEREGGLAAAAGLEPKVLVRREEIRALPFSVLLAGPRERGGRGGPSWRLVIGLAPRAQRGTRDGPGVPSCPAHPRRRTPAPPTAPRVPQRSGG